MKRLILPLFTILLLSIGGCHSGGTGLPRTAMVNISNLESKIKHVAASINRRGIAFEKLKADPDYPKLKKYAEKEKWGNQFSQSQKDLETVKAMINKKIEPLVKKNNYKDHLEINKLVLEGEKTIKKIKEDISYPKKRFKMIRQGIRKPQVVTQKGIDALDQIKKGEITLKEIISSSGKKFPNKAEDLGKRMIPFEKRRVKALSLKEKMDTALKEKDYATFVDQSAALSALAVQDNHDRKKLINRCDTLPKDYSKILTDMKVEYFIIIGRTSWNNALDYPYETNYTYAPIEINETIFDTFLKMPENKVLARLHQNPYNYYNTTPTITPLIPRSGWNMLKIDGGLNLPSKDTMGEFWTSNFKLKYFHKYTMLKGKQEINTGWIEVKESLFLKHTEDLGMVILSKPYGLYEDESIKEATPPGMQYVNNPRYGKWEERDNRRHWVYYNNYGYMNTYTMGHRYSYREYNTWNNSYRNRRGYYGRPMGTNKMVNKAAKPKWGSRSPMAKGRYGRSLFAKRGGFQKGQRRGFRSYHRRYSSNSVRGAGSSRRGGGPGGSGK